MNLDHSDFVLAAPFPEGFNLISAEVLAGESAVVFAVGIGRDWQHPATGYGSTVEEACEAALRESTGRKRVTKSDKQTIVRPLAERVRVVFREAAEV